MTTRRKQSKPEPNIHIAGCTFNGQATQHNEHTAAAIAAIASACRENAVALTKAAEALTPARPAFGIETAIKVGG